MNASTSQLFEVVASPVPGGIGIAEVRSRPAACCSHVKARHARARCSLPTKMRAADQYVGGLSLKNDEVFGARVPMRAHGCAVHPTDPNRVLFFARPGRRQAFELDRATMKARTVFTTEAGRHLAGHGTYSADGNLILTPEHDYERAKGVVVVRDARNFAIVGEIDTNGIDPHEVAWLPDHRSLLVANGGIMTHPRTLPTQTEYSDDGPVVVCDRCGQRRAQGTVAVAGSSVEHSTRLDDQQRHHGRRPAVRRR